MTLDRRSFLALAAGGVATAALAACGGPTDESSSTAPAADTGDDATPATAPVTTVDATGTWIVTGPADRDQVALTFHTDGPVSMVEAVLDLVEERDLVISAFVVGTWLDANPAMGARLRDGGHDIANHTYSHPGFAALAPARMAAEIEQCRAALERHTGSPGRWFRPSGTDNGTDPPPAAGLDAAGAAGYTVIGYDVDPIDFRDPGARAVTERTLATVVPGSIISLHMGHQGTIDAMPALLDGLAARRLTPVSLTTLLG